MHTASFHDMEELDEFIHIDHDHNREVRNNWWSVKTYDGPSALTDSNNAFNPDDWANINKKEAA